MKVVPRPTSLLLPIVPPRAATIRLLIASPIPAPGAAKGSSRTNSRKSRNAVSAAVSSIMAAAKPKYWLAGMSADDVKRERDEMQAFATHLFDAYKQSGKTFVIQNGVPGAKAA